MEVAIIIRQIFNFFDFIEKISTPDSSDIASFLTNFCSTLLINAVKPKSNLLQIVAVCIHQKGAVIIEEINKQLAPQHIQFRI